MKSNGKLLTVYRLSLGKGKAYSVSNCNGSCSYYQNLRGCLPFFQAYDRCLQHSEAKELHNSNAH